MLESKWTSGADTSGCVPALSCRHSHHNIVSVPWLNKALCQAARVFSFTLRCGIYDMIIAVYNIIYGAHRLRPAQVDARFAEKSVQIMHESSGGTRVRASYCVRACDCKCQTEQGLLSTRDNTRAVEGCGCVCVCVCVCACMCVALCAHVRVHVCGSP